MRSVAFVAAALWLAACGSAASTVSGDESATVAGDESAPADGPGAGGPDASQSAAAASPQPDGSGAGIEAARWQVEVLAELPHDPSAFTQGLVFDAGALFESTGRDTSLRRVDPDTGEVLQLVDIDDSYFGEGLELVGDRLIQLTWRSGTAFVYEAASFEEIGRFSYAGEGWGLCDLDDGRLAMSDGTDVLTFRDPVTFAPLGSVRVTLDGQPVSALNELECVDGTVWANVWQTDTIVGIDSGSGLVTDVVDAALLDRLDPADGSNQVLNGIAYLPDTGTFLLTGKEWPTLFEVRLVAPA